MLCVRQIGGQDQDRLAIFFIHIPLSCIYVNLFIEKIKLREDSCVINVVASFHSISIECESITSNQLWVPKFRENV